MGTLSDRINPRSENAYGHIYNRPKLLPERIGNSLKKELGRGKSEGRHWGEKFKRGTADAQAAE
ncbi:hypothetical protein KKC1_33410 [Calderihabitans maritimus]|uniref:Uncharacterized protein n=1 Tax=Calderihabitans maritimus TaxID=1246530 RepID=A0A1Z5HY60_9FIRM|nr:hypothetical protein KKC1_33410 [Calderihabitans maritimus]